MVEKKDIKQEYNLANISSPTSVVAAGLETSVEPITLPPRLTRWKALPASAKSLRTTNPIRAIVDPIIANIQSGEQRGDGKKLISLALGDPTAAGNLPPCPVAIQAVLKALTSPPHAAGYVNACGTPAARQAVAAVHSASPDQVILASGCSGALELILTALLEEGSILLVPRPGFPLYQVIAESHGAKVMHYNLDPGSDWKVDLQHVRELVHQYGECVRGIVINNPSNPTGAVFSREHLDEIVDMCEELQLVIVADEVYGDLVYKGHEFTPLASVAAQRGRIVPVITASGIGKQYLLPGWRVGWAVFQDNVDRTIQEVEAGAKRLAQIILGSSHLAQTAIPALLQDTSGEVDKWKAGIRSTLENQAHHLCNRLAGVPGLRIQRPGGAMYTMVTIDIEKFDDSIQSDLDFSKALLKEENVFVLPGSCFGVDNVFRAVFCAPVDVLDEATHRIHRFCDRHT